MSLRAMPALPIVAIRHDDAGTDCAFDCPMCTERFWVRHPARVQRVCPSCRPVILRAGATAKHRRYDMLRRGAR